MNKAVIGAFPDNLSAARAINDLKAYGFGGETITQILREDLPRGERLAGPRVMPAMELIKGLIIGAIAGGILGAIASFYLGMTMSWASFGYTQPFYSAIFTFAAVGAICGVLEGLAAVGPLVRARRAVLLRHRGDCLVIVHTDETHAARATDILRAAGANDVRRGAGSMSDEFRTSEAVQPETYGAPVVVQREPVEAPGTSGEVIEHPTSGGTLG